MYSKKYREIRHIMRTFNTKNNTEFYRCTLCNKYKNEKMKKKIIIKFYK